MNSDLHYLVVLNKDYQICKVYLNASSAELVAYQSVTYPAGEYVHLFGPMSAYNQQDIIDQIKVLQERKDLMRMFYTFDPPASAA